MKVSTPPYSSNSFFCLILILKNYIDTVLVCKKPFSDNADVALMTKLLTLNLLKKVHVRHRLIQIDLQEFHHCHLYTVKLFVPLSQPTLCFLLLIILDFQTFATP